MEKENAIIYRNMVEEDIYSVHKLIKDTFLEFIAKDYSKEGINEFMNYINTENLLERLKKENISIISEANGKVIGFIGLKDLNHISLFFVDKEYKGRGIGKTLYKKALGSIKEIKKDLKEVTVNSSPYALNVYRKLGFKQIKEQVEINGIKFIPMKIII